ncbi:MAG: SHOCT domain-containing protein [Verrucomicrobiaceae bacterium]|nr:MAG: SHOCT domain-containing protein [Verrucomicrobiaceae bacterium]
MSLSDELQRLADLKSSGALTQAEFEQAKAKLLQEDAVPRRPKFDGSRDDSLGRAANRYVTFQFIMGMIALLFFLFVIGPKMCSSSSPSFGPSGPMRFP